MSRFKLNLFWLIVFAATMPLAVVLSTNMARRSFERVKLRDQTVTVKGFAERGITSDRGEWSASIVVRDTDLTQAYAQLEAHRSGLMAFLATQGFPAEAVSLWPVDISVVYKQLPNGNRTNEIEYYALSQGFTVTSDQVQRIADAARAASTLIREGIELNARSPRYLYTKLEEMKLQMIAEATVNARQRAEALVDNSGGSLGPVRAASQGVFQITPAFSTDVSGMGEYDTGSIQKAIKAVVTIEYAIAG